MNKITYPAYTEKDGKSYYKEEVYTYTAKDINDSAIKRALCEIKVAINKVNESTGKSVAVNAEVTYCDDRGYIWRVLTDDYTSSSRTNLNAVDYIRGANNEVVTLRTKNVSSEGGYAQTTYVYDGFNRVTKVKDSYNGQYIVEYNDIERSKLVYFLPNGQTGSAENHYKEFYDVKGNVVSQYAYPNGISGTPIKISREYDIVGNVVKSINPNGYATTYDYNPLNELTKVTDAKGQVIQYTYDNHGNNTTFTQSEGDEIFTYTYTYDAADNILKTVSASGKTTAYTYDKLGNVASIIAPDGRVTYNKYYNNGLLASESVEGNKRIYTYDISEQVSSSVVSGIGQAISKDYTGNGLVTHKLVGTHTTTFAYDANNNLKTITDPFGLTVNYGYDRLNRVSSVTAEGKTFTYVYYPDGMVKSITVPVSGGQLVRTYTYDNMNRIKSLKNTLSGTTISTYTYTYDANSNITKIVEQEKLTDGKTRNRTSNYTYDVLDQLLTVSSTDGRNITYSYDSRGNRSIAEATGLALKSTELSTPQALKVDFLEREVTEEVVQELEVAQELEIAALEYDVLDISFGYNVFEELSESKVNGQNYTYTYDTEGMRVKKESQAATINYYYNDNGEVIAESNKNGQVTAQNIWSHEILARKIGGQYYYYVTNGHGDITQVISEQGKIVNTYQYDEWGNILNQVEGISNPIRYASEYYDEESGLYYLRARYYDPLIGRFIGEDPVHDGTNWYIYCYNNPLRYIDPSGNIPVETVVDVMNIAVSTKDFITDPSLANAAYVIWDVGAAVVPYVPGSYVKKGTTAVTKAAKKSSKAAAQKSVKEAVKKTQCFTAGTLIATENGLKPIEEIQVGENVWASNPQTREVVLKPVIQTFKGSKSCIIELLINGENIETTKEHPFWIEDKGWVDAKDLSVGDKVRLQSGKTATIQEKVIKIINESVDVYNFEVADLHTYFVGEQSLLVHNKCGAIAAAFEKAISKLPASERVAAVKTEAKRIAAQAGFVKDSKLTKMNNRDIYKNPKTGEYFAVDTQHGRFERLDKRGKHLGEVDFDFKEIANSRDKSGGHDIKVK